MSHIGVLQYSCPEDGEFEIYSVGDPKDTVRFLRDDDTVLGVEPTPLG
jgi:hypothetical protein